MTEPGGAPGLRTAATASLQVGLKPGGAFPSPSTSLRVRVVQQLMPEEDKCLESSLCFCHRDQMCVELPGEAATEPPALVFQIL